MGKIIFLNFFLMWTSEADLGGRPQGWTREAGDMPVAVRPKDCLVYYFFTIFQTGTPIITRGNLNMQMLAIQDNYQESRFEVPFKS